MKFLRIPSRTIIVTALLFCSYIGYSQVKFNIGGFLGGGSIKGNSSSVASFTSSAFIETNTTLFLEVTPRLSFIYARDIDAVLPNTRKPYYPYLFGVSLKGITSQPFDHNIFLEEGIGLLVINDRTFSDTNTWDHGVVLSLNGGWNINGFKIGAGIEYGITFTNTLAQYSSFHFYINYSI